LDALHDDGAHVVVHDFEARIEWESIGLGEKPLTQSGVAPRRSA